MKGVATWPGAAFPDSKQYTNEKQWVLNALEKDVWQDTKAVSHTVGMHISRVIGYLDALRTQGLIERRHKPLKSGNVSESLNRTKQWRLA